jgi:hypothetical protein
MSVFLEKIDFGMRKYCQWIVKNFFKCEKTNINFSCENIFDKSKFHRISAIFPYIFQINCMTFYPIQCNIKAFLKLFLNKFYINILLSFKNRKFNQKLYKFNIITV